MFGMDIKMIGASEFKDLMSQVDQLNTRISGVELIADRKDGADTEDIVKSLKDSDRDFFSADSAVEEKVASAFAEELERRLAAASASGRPSPTDDSLAAAGLIAAMKAYMAAVVERIENQRTASGGAPRGLTEAYKKYKMSKYGFETPIGKASGQLLAALVPGGGTAGKIQLIRK